MNAIFIEKRAAWARSICWLLALLATPGIAESADTAKLLQSAASGNAKDRYTAIDDLGELHEAAAQVVPRLQALLQDKDAPIRWRSARALSDYGEQAQSAAPELRKLLADSDPIVQYHAAVALGKIGDRSDETTRALVQAATSDDARVARSSIAALRRLKPGPQHVLSALGEVLKSNDNVVVLHALEAIVEHGEDAVPLLNEALKRPETTFLACAAIEHIGPEAAGTVPALTELLGDTKHSHLLVQTLLALASIGPPAQTTSPQIVALLEHATDETVPVAAAYALGSIRAADADQALRAAASKPNALLQMIATWSLARIHPDDVRLQQQAKEKLQAGLKSKDPAIQAAAEHGLKLLEPPVKQAAIE